MKISFIDTIQVNCLEFAKVENGRVLVFEDAERAYPFFLNEEQTKRLETFISGKGNGQDMASTNTL